MPHHHSTQIARFWAKVRRCEHNTTCDQCCWPWLGTSSAQGYGRSRYVLYDTHGRFIETYAHRIAWALFYGTRLGAYEGCHTCDTPTCCNPHHIWNGTHAQNHQDSTIKGRRHRGERASQPQKLTKHRVLQIWHAWYSGSTQREIAQQFRISQPLVSQILTRKVWTWLAPPRP